MERDYQDTHTHILNVFEETVVAADNVKYINSIVCAYLTLY